MNVQDSNRVKFIEIISTWCKWLSARDRELKLDVCVCVCVGVSDSDALFESEMSRRP